MSLSRLSLLFTMILFLGACAKNDLTDPPVPLGDFKLGLNIVVADNAQKVPISRSATADEWEAELKKAVDARFGRYEGDKFYNIGINVDGFAIAPPGIPLLVAPKSVLAIKVTVWDDAAGRKLNEEPKQLIVFESFSSDTVIGTGITRSRAQQMAALSFNAARSIEKWFLENPEWFGLPPLALPEDTANVATAN